MKILLMVGLAFWGICGVAGGWMLDDFHWRTVVRGPLALVQAFNDDPVTIPTGR